MWASCLIICWGEERGSMLDLFARETTEIIHISTEFTEKTGRMRSFA